MACAYFCDSCDESIPLTRARLRCLTCRDYDSCADCHHRYEVWRRGQMVASGGGPAPTVERREEPSTAMPRNLNAATVPASGTTMPQPPSGTTSMPQPPVVSEAYWGMLITPARTPSGIFSRLIAAVFAHFATESPDVLQPSEFCALMAAAGYSADFPPLQISTNEAAPPADLHTLDAWLVNWYRSFAVPLDHRMATREFSPPPPVQPHNGRIRMRDQLAHAMMYPPAPVVPNGLPLLSQRGLEQYFMSQAMEGPSNLSARINSIPRALPPLTDQETGRPFEAGAIPRQCFPLVPDPEVTHRRMVMQQQAAAMLAQQQAQAIAYEKRLMYEDHLLNEAGAQARRNCTGGWVTDAYGNRTYKQGYL
ncbi:hypothetical protein C8A01DRAFT_51533 [Parachaetomium inaequale]|uniref:DUF7514 domain-containing protein n=1 Tax=Parachaetomium inaequale TaxID=2588326 RepID=A0AAN6SL65_9PEZI|nr:hypothetical protein C8A01DRAFT_51533 [Parachaetomium inaequale]